MPLSSDEVKEIAHLARLRIESTEQLTRYQDELGTILELVAQMDSISSGTDGVDLDAVAPMAHPLDAHQRLRDDRVTETDQRERFQTNAPVVEDGLYLVPKVID